MADSIREKIITKLITEVSNILQVNSYQTDIGQNVFRAYRPGLSKPSIIVNPQPETVQRTGYKMDAHSFPIRFEGFATFDEDIDGASVIGERIYSDIVQCIFAVSWTGTGVEISRTLWAEGGIAEYPQPRDEYVGAYALINFVFDTVIGDPFNQ